MYRMATLTAASPAVALLALLGTRLHLLSPMAGVGLCGAVLGVLCTAVALGSARPELALFGPTVLRAPAESGAVVLTFDDGPDPYSTPPLLDALDAAGASATFFLLADRVKAHPELARRIAAKHEVALHGASHHPWLTLRSPRRGAAELRQAARDIEAVTGQRPTRFRPPFGAVSPRVYAAAAQAELTVVWCSLRTGDGGPLSDATLQKRCALADPGDIVLLHEGERPAACLLPTLLAAWQERGLRVCAAREVLA